MTPRPPFNPTVAPPDQAAGDCFVIPELGRFTAPGFVSKFCLMALPIWPAVFQAASDDVFGPVIAQIREAGPFGWPGSPSALDALAEALGLPFWAEPD